MNPLIEEATRLHNEGKSYSEIATIQGCSKSTAAWRANSKCRDLNRKRGKRYADENPTINKVWKFKSKNKSTTKTKVRSFQTRSGGHCSNKRTHDFTLKDVTAKFGSQPSCYLTGRKLDWEKPSTYSFDHIVPATRGGDNSLENMGLTHRQANQAKTDLTLNEFICLCREVLEHNGFTVIPKDAQGTNRTSDLASL